MPFKEAVDKFFDVVVNVVFSYAVITVMAVLTCATAAMFVGDFNDYADAPVTSMETAPLSYHILSGKSVMKWRAELMFLGAQFVSLTTGITITRVFKKNMWTNVIGTAFFLTWLTSLILWFVVGHRHEGTSKDLTIAAGSLTSVMAFFAFCVGLTQWIGSGEFLSSPLSDGDTSDSSAIRLMHPLLARPISLLYPISAAIMLAIFTVRQIYAPTDILSAVMLEGEWIISTFVASQLTLYWVGIAVAYDRTSTSNTKRKNGTLVPAALLWLGLTIATFIETQEDVANSAKMHDLGEIVGIFELSFAVVLAVGLNELCKHATSSSGEFYVTKSRTPKGLYY